MSENRKKKEKRLEEEYAAYLAQCEVDKVEPIRFINWSFNAKVDEKAEAGDEKWLRKSVGDSTDEHLAKGKLRREAKEKAARDKATPQ